MLDYISEPGGHVGHSDDSIPSASNDSPMLFDIAFALANTILSESITA